MLLIGAFDRCFFITLSVFSFTLGHIGAVVLNEKEKANKETKTNAVKSKLEISEQVIPGLAVATLRARCSRSNDART